MKFITANMKGQDKFDISADCTVFLAGPITFAPDWQNKFFRDLFTYWSANKDKGTDNITVTLQDGQNLFLYWAKRQN